MHAARGSGASCARVLPGTCSIYILEFDRNVVSSPSTAVAERGLFRAKDAAIALDILFNIILTTSAVRFDETYGFDTHLVASWVLHRSPVS